MSRKLLWHCVDGEFFEDGELLGRRVRTGLNLPYKRMLECALGFRYITQNEYENDNLRNDMAKAVSRYRQQVEESWTQASPNGKKTKGSKHHTLYSSSRFPLTPCSCKKTKFGDKCTSVRMGPPTTPYIKKHSLFPQQNRCKFYESDIMCEIGCGSSCRMQSSFLFQNKFKVRFVPREDMGICLQALTFVPCGSFVLPYAGLVRNHKELTDKDMEYACAIEKTSPTFSLHKKTDKESEGQQHPSTLVVDASQVGGPGRFAPSSCQPNMQLLEIAAGHEFILQFTTNRDIYPGEIMSWDYGWTNDDFPSSSPDSATDQKPKDNTMKLPEIDIAPSKAVGGCRCGAPNCKNRENYQDPRKYTFQNDKTKLTSYQPEPPTEDYKLEGRLSVSEFQQLMEKKTSFDFTNDVEEITSSSSNLTYFEKYGPRVLHTVPTIQTFGAYSQLGFCAVESFCDYSCAPFPSNPNHAAVLSHSMYFASTDDEDEEDIEDVRNMEDGSRVDADHADKQHFGLSQISKNSLNEPWEAASSTCTDSVSSTPQSDDMAATSNSISKDEYFSNSRTDSPQPNLLPKNSSFEIERDYLPTNPPYVGNKFPWQMFDEDFQEMQNMEKLLIAQVSEEASWISNGPHGNDKKERETVRENGTKSDSTSKDACEVYTRESSKVGSGYEFDLDLNTNPKEDHIEDHNDHFEAGIITRRQRSSILETKTSSPTISALTASDIMMRQEAELKKRGKRVRLRLENKFQCDVCLYSTNRECELADHQSFHQKERKYACNVKGCTAKFKHRAVLANHKLSHMPKTLKCNYGCGLQFNRSDHKLRHERHACINNPDRTPRPY